MNMNCYLQPKELIHSTKAKIIEHRTHSTALITENNVLFYSLI
jgi:hypothetical protein